ncbi:MAG: hypothetical protein EPO22_12295 [Dehalococcoidia bacterium]|nr:MAG: hypothetical protein EPO22_12295 [Dehalococcoidia bacterium]
MNTASRLSGAAGGGKVWFGEGTLDRLGGHIETDTPPQQQLNAMITPIADYRLHHSPGANAECAPVQDVAL